MAAFFHLAATVLVQGSIIAPGNFGRVLRFHGWRHTQALREMAIEASRKARFSHLPSRFEAAFAFETQEEAFRFKSTNPGFEAHICYRVRLREPEALCFTTDWRLVSPFGDFFGAWPDVYWHGVITTSIPGIQWPHGEGAILHREMLTLSHLVIEERLYAV